MTITEIAIKRPTLIVVIFTVIAILGIISYSRLSYNLFPRFETPVVSVVTVYPGAAPGEVETSVTEVIEDALASIENLDKISSVSQEGVSFVVLQLANNADVDLALQEAQRKINATLANLPDQADPPSLNKFSFDDLPIMQFSATANLSPTQFYDLLDNRIIPELSKTEGIGQITLVGGTEREIQVSVQREKLQAYGISLQQVVNTVLAANQDFPTGNIEGRTNQYSLRLSGKFRSLEELANVVIVNNPDGSQIKLADVGMVTDGTEDIESINRINGNSAVGILIQKQTDANAVEVSELVKERMEELEEEYSKTDLNFVIASDTSVFTLAAANAVVHDLMIAVLLVALVMLIFLHSLRNAAIVMIAIPASIIATFIAMYVFNFSLNLMTLMALSLVIGILVDDSIVVLENIYRHLEMGKDKRTAALQGRNEIGFTALSITLVDIVVFAPLSVVGGLIGNILREFAIVVIFSTLMSLFVSFTITPMLASRFSKIIKLSKKNIFGRFSLAFESQFEKLKHNYASTLRWSLTHRRIVGLITLLLLIASIALVPTGFIGSTFIASGDRGEFVVTLELDQKSTIYQTNLVTKQAENLILNKPEVEKVFSSVGQSTTMGANQSSNNVSQLTVQMIDKEERAISVDDFANQIKNEIAQIPGVKVSSVPTGLTGSAADLPIQLVLKGTDLSQVQKAANTILEKIKKIPGISDPTLSVDEGRPEVQVVMNRKKMASLGLSVADVGSTLLTAYTGNTEAVYREGNEEYDIRIELDEFDREDIEDVRNLTFKNPKGELIQLSQFAEIHPNTGPTQLERSERISSVTVESNVVGRPVGTVGQEIEAAISADPLPPGVTLSYEGQLEQQAEAFGSLIMAFWIGIVFVYLIMVALYESYLYPLVVLFSIPLAVIGALIALALTMETLNIFSILGMIMMMGLVAKNAILLVDFTNNQKAFGSNTFDALLEAGRERLRPILMTTLTMIFGMLPIALASGAASEAKNGLAWVLIGGLTSSMFLTLLIVPIVYLTFDNMKERIKKWRDKENPKNEGYLPTK